MIYRILKTANICRNLIEQYGVILRETPLYIVVEASPHDIELLEKQCGITALPEGKLTVRKHQTTLDTGNSETITIEEIKTLVGFDVLQSMGYSDEGITVAILGTGVNLDVLPSTIRERVEVVDYTGEGPDDYLNHGTPVTYLIAALTNKAKVVHLKVINKDHVIEGKSLLDAFEYAYFNCHIVNCSWGFESDPCQHYKKYNALMQFITYTDPPFYFVASAGNEDAQPNAISFPAASEYAIAVGAIDKNGLVAPFSSVGPFQCNGMVIPKPDVTTYGVNIELIDANGEVKPLSGTSFSAPIVAAFIAWLYGKEAYTKGLDILVGHRINPLCQCEGYTPDYGYGILKAHVNAPRYQPVGNYIANIAMCAFAFAVPIILTAQAFKTIKSIEI